MSSGDLKAAAPTKFGTISEWCRQSGMGVTATYQALARGDLKAIRLGRRTLVNIEAGLGWLRSQPAWSPTGPVARRRR